MFLPDWQPITVDLPTEWEFAHLYFVHDLHYGSELFDERKWMRLKNRILSDKYGKVLFIGDLFENAIPGSKSDMFTQTANPEEQKEFVTQQFVDLKEQTIAIVPGNHCSNRTTKAAGIKQCVGFSICNFKTILDARRELSSVCSCATNTVKCVTSVFSFLLLFLLLQLCGFRFS